MSHISGEISSPVVFGVLFGWVCFKTPRVPPAGAASGLHFPDGKVFLSHFGFKKIKLPLPIFVSKSPQQIIKNPTN